MAAGNDTLSAPCGATARRALLGGAAAVGATVAGLTSCRAAPPAAAPPTGGASAAASPELAGAIADYWRGVAECNAPGVADEMVEAKCDEIRDAAARVAAAPCRGLADIAAKVVFFVAVAEEQNALGYVTSAEGDVLLSAKAALLALTGGAA